jgi:hypothetical protein
MVKLETNRKSKAESRPRAALAWGVAVFLAAQIGLALAIEIWWPILRDPFFGYKAAHLGARIQGDSSTPYTVVMLGSSRTAAGFEAGILERQLERALDRRAVAFNFGVPGSGPVTQLLHFKRLLAKGIKPSLLLVEVLPPLLDGQLGVPREACWLPATRLWLRELREVRRFGFPTGEMNRTWWQSWPLPCFSHRFAIVSRLAPAWLPYQLLEDWGRGDDSCGWAPRPQQNNTPALYQRALAHARAEYAGYLKTFRLGGPACSALAEVLALCRREGVAAALVLMPEGPAFRSWYAPGAREQIDAFLNELGGAFNVPLIDARAWLGEQDFSDSHHMRGVGAAAFTRRLTRDEILPLLRHRARDLHALDAGREPATGRKSTS